MDQRSFFTLAELDKMAIECGFSSMQTKEVLKNLQDDNLVKNDK